MLEQEQYAELFNKQKEKEIEESKRKSDEKNINNIKRQEQLKSKINKSLEELREKIEYKEKKSEKILLRLNKNKERKLIEEKNKQKEREEYALQYLLKTQQMQEKNRRLYCDKQSQLEHNIFLKKMEEKERKQTMYNKLFNKNNITIENRKYLEKEDKKKRQAILKKIELIDFRVKDKQKKAEMESVKKREEERLKSFEKTLSIERKNRLIQYNTMRIEEQLNEKDKKIAYLKNQKALLEQQNAEMAMHIIRQKDDILNKFEKIMSQKTEISPELIRKVFPEDDELFEKVVNLKKKQMKDEKKIQSKFALYSTFQKNTISLKKKNKNKSVRLGNREGNSSSSEIKGCMSNREIIKKKYAEDERIKKEKKEIEIKNKIEEYKSELQKEFEKLIIEEKKKEDERIKKYEEEKDNELKQKLEKQNSIERAEVTNKINKAKENMDKKIKEYELKLRSNT